MNRAVLFVLTALVAVPIAWSAFRPAPTYVVSIDLIDRFASAVDKQPDAKVFTVENARIAGTARRSIVASGAGSIAWSLTVPKRAWLEVSGGVLEEGWTMPGDGVVFRVLIDNDEIVSRVIDPYGKPEDRRWHDFMLDLSGYAGKTVKVFLRTNSGLPGHDDRNGDYAAWGTPRIVTS